VPLIFGNLTAEHYEDSFHQAHPEIDRLREKMQVIEDERYTREYLEADKRSIANAVQVFFSDGSSTDKIAVEYPIGHRRRREEGMPLLVEKFRANLQTRFPVQQCDAIMDSCASLAQLEVMPVHEFVSHLT
jgi:2-methylcitrate dehydratase